MAIERRRERTGEQRRSRDGRRRSIEGRRRGRSKLQTRSSRSIEASNQVIEVDRSFNQVLNMICCWVDDPNSMANQLHLSRIKDYLWVAEDGMKMQGYNGSQLWDFAFAVQAILSTNLVDEHGSMLKKSHEFIKISQVRDHSSGNLSFWYRHISKGGWPFSTPDNGWPVSDCTAEGLKAALMLSQMPSTLVGETIAVDQLYNAVNFILSLQIGF